ncbi:Crp/Fnr family transcriptional regulator [candidate division KSB1 bacterium]|nr:Crp/Fnr family transcriptional regulator [candidate division KSB1 bacterium]
MLTIVEKVLFLQEVDIFSYTPTEDIAHIAAITDVVTYPEGFSIFKEGDISNSMFMVIEGDVQLTRDKSIVMTARSKDVFGTWALFDDEPRVVTATTVGETKLLRIDKDDFYELLADHAQITQSVLKTMVKRLRSLIERVGI